MNRLDGKVALIVGASPNMGGTIANYMAREGARVAVSDIVPDVAHETVEFLRAKGYEALAVPGDGSEEQEVEAIVRQVVGHFGHVDTLVNLAGRQLRWPVTDVNIHDWNLQIKTFLTAGMLTTKYTARAMIDQGRQGCLMHILSSAAHHGEPGNSGYSAAKAGLLNFSRAAAMDLAPKGIRVNTITPFFMEHNLWRMPPAPPSNFRLPAMTTAEDFLKSVPLGRFPRASDIAYTAIFFASDEAEFLTGVDIPVDGGLRAKYPPWVPGEYTGATIEKYREMYKPQRYGEPVEDS